MTNFKNTKRKVKNAVRKTGKWAASNPSKVVQYAGYAYTAAKIAQMASMINAEKKRNILSGSTIFVGQLNGNTNGYYAFDCTPAPAEGVTSITRNGNSIKLSSSFMRFQFSQQSAVTNPIKIRIRMDLVKGTPQTPGNWPATVLSPNPFVTGGNIIDYNSNTNPDYYGTLQTIFSRSYTLKQDQITGGNTILDVSIPLKYFKGKGHHVRFGSDAAIASSEGQLILFITMDNGNMSATVPTTLGGLPLNGQGINTGVYMSYNIIHYFYDN